MGILIELVVALVIVGALFFYRCERVVVTAVTGLMLLFYTIFSSFSWLFIFLAWLLYAGLSLFFAIDELRLPYLTEPLLQFFRKSLPPLSETERVAMDAGDVWWDGDLFAGSPNWEKLHAISKPTLSEEEIAFIDDEVETLCQMLHDNEIVAKGDLPPEVWTYIKEKGFWGLCIPKNYGGKAFSALAHSTIVTKIASRSTSAAVTIMVPNSLGPAELIHLYGSDEQKNTYLPRLAKGIDIPCFALTGVHAGSDAGSITDAGIVCYEKIDNKKTLGIRLSWDKRYITLAPVATVLGLAFKLTDPDHLLGDKTDIGITLALIPTNHPGVEVGERHLPMGLGFMNGPTRGKNVFIPLEWIIGGKEMAGEGWRMLMEALSIGRGISLPALATATGQLYYRTTGAYARIRKQFKMPIGYFEGIQEALARIAGFTYILEASRVLTAHAVDLSIKPAVVSAIAKYHMTELNRQIMNDAMDIHAGRAIQMGERNYLALHYSAIPISITVEGANILTRNLIIFGQGAVRCHPFIRQEMAVAAEADPLLAFDKLLVSHLSFTVSNFVRTFAYGLTGARIAAKPVEGELGYYYQQLTRVSAALAVTADIAMLMLGGDLKRRENLSARLGDVLSHLYLGSAVLKYHYDQQQPKEDIPHAKWALDYCLNQIQCAFDAFFDNFSPKPLAMALRFVVFPYGRVYKGPSDKLSQTIAKSIMEISSLRDRLTQYCYRGKSETDPVGRMEIALQKVINAELAEKKWQKAVKSGQISAGLTFEEQMQDALKLKVLSPFEVQALKDALKAVDEAVAVDEFPFDLGIASASKLKKKLDEK